MPPGAGRLRVEARPAEVVAAGPAEMVAPPPMTLAQEAVAAMAYCDCSQTHTHTHTQHIFYVFSLHSSLILIFYVCVARFSLNFVLTLAC